MESKTYEGKCFCGAVEVAVRGAPEGMGYCHCTSCRTWSAAPVNAFVLWKAGAVAVTKGADHVGTFSKSPNSFRKWCKVCGSHLMTEHPMWGLVDVYAATTPGLPFAAGIHVNYQESVLPMRDDLPKHKDLPKEMGGSGELIAEPMSIAATTPSAKEMQLKSWTGVAPGWRKHDAYFTKSAAAASEKMLDAAGVRPGHRVLDIAAGVGEPAIAAARRVGPNGFVLGTDFVEPMLAFAREKAAAAGLRNVEFRCVDGEAIDEPPGSFDAVTIRWGIMFMPGAPRCLESARRALKNGGRIAVACWAGPERNLWASLPVGILMRLAGVPKPPPGALGVFAYADPRRLEGALVEAGFKNVLVESVDLPMIDFATFDEYWTWTRELVGPVASLLEKLTPAQRSAAAAELEAEVTKVSPRGRTVIGGTTWVASARA